MELSGVEPHPLEFFQKNLNRNKIVGSGSCSATERYFEKSSNLRFSALL